MSEILILYYSRNGSVEQLANIIARGVAEAGVVARLRTVPAVSPNHVATEASVPDSGAPYVTKQDLAECSGLILGSPTRFGNMAAPMKYFWDTTGAEWASGSLVGKPAGVFTSTATMHGGQESTLLSMMLPLLHHGCLIVGVPFTEAAVSNTQTGGTPYGASHVSGADGKKVFSDDENVIAKALGKRIAQISQKLSA
ncbi:MAG: NAD(P)H:quinone oxidoreductase [Arenimonas sp.]|nr:NAD(P)H:quinone oxidoreductase [Arenimonas sp.]